MVLSSNMKRKGFIMTKRSNVNGSSKSNSAKRIRFTKDKIRFVVTENDCKFYRREYFSDSEMETAVTPQHAGQLRKKYADVISAARMNIGG